MKPEEAIGILDLLTDTYKPNKVQEALDTAISALKEIQQYREIKRWKNFQKQRKR